MGEKDTHVMTNVFARPKEELKTAWEVKSPEVVVDAWPCQMPQLCAHIHTPPHTVEVSLQKQKTVNYFVRLILLFVFLRSSIKFFALPVWIEMQGVCFVFVFFFRPFLLLFSPFCLNVFVCLFFSFQSFCNWWVPFFVFVPLLKTVPQPNRTWTSHNSASAHQLLNSP